jgi:NADH dehydrogenase
VYKDAEAHISLQVSKSVILLPFLDIFVKLTFMQQKGKRVVIVGGGFTGVETAQKLKCMLGEKLSVTLISNKSYFEYYPALYRLITGASPIEVCVPLTDMVPEGVDIVLDTVTAVDLSSKKVTCASGDTYEADYLVLAVGSETTYFGLPGLSTLSFGFKSAKEAMNLKRHLHLLFANHANPDPRELVAHFHVIVIGGGPTGCEVAGDLVSYLAMLARHYGVDPSFITVDLIEGMSRLAPALPVEASERILKRLHALGVNVFLNRKLESEEVESVYLKDMTMKSKTVIWTAGTKLHSLYETIQGITLSDKKRVLVDEYLQVVGQENVFVGGDAAATAYGGLAQTAIYDGSYIAQQIMRDIRGRALKAYVPKKTAFAIPVGTGWAVVVAGPIRLYGSLAYVIRHVIDFMYFAKILSIPKLFDLFFKGWKYRSVIPKN